MRPLAVLVSSLLAAAPAGDETAADVLTTGDEAPVETQQEESPEYVAARDLFDEGMSHYDTADYEQAVSAWVQAHAKLPRVAEYRQIRAELVYNIATAQRKWFDIDKDVRHLRQALRSLEGFIDDIPDIYEGAEKDAETKKATDLAQTLRTQIEDFENAEEQAEIDRQERLRPKFDPVVDAREAKRNKALLISGGTFTGLGVAAFGMMTAGLILGNDIDSQIASLDTESELAKRRDLISRGQTHNALAISGIVIGSVCTLIGIPLLATGGAFEKRRREYKAGLSASFGRRSSSVALTLRF